MTKIIFENLPSTNTPINAENLNKLNNVIVSNEEPTTGEEVWIEKGKNLFDKTLEIRNDFTISDVGAISGATAFVQLYFIPVKSLCKYTLSTQGSLGRLILAEYNGNHSFIKRNIMRESNSLTIETDANTKFLRVSAFPDNLETLQLEQGEVATEYEPFMPKKIHTKNNNNEYEEFYNGEPKRRVVWTNYNPTSSMGYVAAIYLDNSYVNYDELEFWCYGNTGNSSFQVSKTKPGYSTTVINFAGYTGDIVGRSFTYRSDGGYSIGDCYIYGASDTTPPTASNSSLIPAFIVAIKY